MDVIRGGGSCDLICTCAPATVATPSAIAPRTARALRLMAGAGN
jgi:hypothetical protein